MGYNKKNIVVLTTNKEKIKINIGKTFISQSKKEEKIITRTVYTEFWNEKKVLIVWHGGKEYIVGNKDIRDVYRLGRCITV